MKTLIARLDFVECRCCSGSSHLIQGERNYIMQVVCEATQNPNTDVQVGAFECLVKIMSLYYDKMGYYMERALFGVCRACLTQLMRLTPPTSSR